MFMMNMKIPVEDGVLGGGGRRRWEAGIGLVLERGQREKRSRERMKERK